MVFVAALIMGALGFLCFQFMIKKITIRVDEYSTNTEKKEKMTAEKKAGAKPKKKPESAEKLEEKTLIEKAEEKSAEDDADISCIKD